MGKYNTKAKIIEHYDSVSPYYYTLWGEHLHHGYWQTGKETKEQAQVALIDHLAELAEIKSGSKILDVGCGFGGSSIYLAKKFNARTTGITISPVQVGMANEAAARTRADSKFLLMDAQGMKFDEPFDVIWSIESISHYQNKKAFFDSAAKLVKPGGGTIAFIDWFKKEGLSADKYKKFIQPIEKGMFVDLETIEDYKKQLESNGLKVVKTEDISRNCAKTWDISLDIIKNKTFWKLATKGGRDFINFLLAFRAMRAGFASGNFVYGAIVAKRP